MLLLALGLAACRGATPTVRNLPAGTYTNAQYHFTVRYPNGWQTNVSPQSSPLEPLTLTITRSSAVETNGSLVSAFTVTVFDASNSAIATPIAALPANPTLSATTLGGLPAYQDKPISQQLPNTHFTATHTDYYLVTGGYEYQISTDAVQSDNADAALASMLKSFTITP